MKKMNELSRLRDDTYMKILVFTTDLFKTPVKTFEELEVYAKDLLPAVEKFIMELSAEEQKVLDFDCPSALRDFIKSVGATQLPEDVKKEMW